MVLRMEWRTGGEFDVLLVVDEDGTVREAFRATPELLSRFLTEMGSLDTWMGDQAVNGDRRAPAAWGDLVIARAATGEVLTIAPELFWEGIYLWFRSRGVDYDTRHS